MNYDLFISHASEDKDIVARPLAMALAERGLAVWYDEFELRIGDSISQSIAHGLSSSNYGVVVLSPSFVAKPWPQHELQGLTALAMHTERRIILPVWHQVTAEEVLRFSPPLADTIALSTSDGIEHLVNELVDVTRPDVAASTIARARRLLGTGEVSAAVVLAAGVLEHRLKEHARARLSYRYFRKKPLRVYGLRLLVRTLQDKGYLPATGHGSEADYDFIIRTRNAAAHQPNEVSSEQARQFFEQVECVLDAMEDS